MKQFTVTKCKEPRCGLCKYLKEGYFFTFKRKQLNVNADMTCTVKNAIYVTESRGCRKYYIGGTNNSEPTTLHDKHIRHDNVRMIPVSGHIACCSNMNPRCFMFPFFKMNIDSIRDRKEKDFHSKL